MKVWWCEEHLCGNLPNRDTEGWASVPGQRGACFFAEEFGSESACRMVEMQLVPADARMVSGELQCPNCKFVYETEPPKDPWDYDP